MTNAQNPTTGPTDAQIELLREVREYALENYDTAGWDIVTETMDDEDLLAIIGKVRTAKSAIARVAEHIAPAAEARAEAIAEGGEDGAYDDSAESGPVVEEITVPGTEETPSTEVVVDQLGIVPPAEVKAAPVHRTYTAETDPSILANFEVRPDLVGVRSQNWVKAPIGLHADVEGGCLKTFKAARTEDRDWVVEAFAAELVAIETGAPRKVNFCPRCVIQMKSAPVAAKAPKAKAPKAAKVTAEDRPTELDIEVTDELRAKFDAQIAEMAGPVSAPADEVALAEIAELVAAEKAEKESADLQAQLAASIEAAPAKGARKGSKKATQA